MDNQIIDPTDEQMSPPWIGWSNKVRELFKQDPEVVKMTWSDKTYELHIYVSNPLKVLAIRELLPKEKTFGKVVVKVFVERANRRGGDKYVPELVAAAFEGNPLYEYQHIWNDPKATFNPFCWVVMSNQAVQYPDDNLHDLYGDTTILPETLISDVLDTDFMFYCSRNPERPIPEGDEK